MIVCGGHAGEPGASWSEGTPAVGHGLAWHSPAWTRAHGRRMPVAGACLWPALPAVCKGARGIDHVGGGGGGGGGGAAACGPGLGGLGGGGRAAAAGGARAPPPPPAPTAWVLDALTAPCRRRCRTSACRPNTAKQCPSDWHRLDAASGWGPRPAHSPVRVRPGVRGIMPPMVGAFGRPATRATTRGPCCCFNAPYGWGLP